MTECLTGVVVITADQPLRLGDIRRFVALMDAQGADDQAAVFGSVRPSVPTRRPGDEFPAGLAELDGIGGFPRTSRGPWPPRRR